MLSVIAPVAGVSAVQPIKPVAGVAYGDPVAFFPRTASSVSTLPFGSGAVFAAEHLSPRLNEFLTVGKAASFEISFKEFHEWNLEVCNAVGESESLGVSNGSKLCSSWHAINVRDEFQVAPVNADLSYADFVRSAFTAGNWWSKGAFEAFATTIVYADTGDELAPTIIDAIADFSREERLILWRDVVSKVLSSPHVTCLSAEFREQISELIREFAKYKSAKLSDRKAFHTVEEHDDTRERVLEFNLMTGVSPPVVTAMTCRRLCHYRFRGELNAQIFKPLSKRAVPNRKGKGDSCACCSACALCIRCASTSTVADPGYWISPQFAAHQNQRLEAGQIHGPSSSQLLDYVSVA
ncbi:MAG: hypothetical protein KGL11_02915 [Alphaproteobacteria bacterium]|nr:hypothetical protein [Alphaproteobacteria bacterium]